MSNRVEWEYDTSKVFSVAYVPIDGVSDVRLRVWKWYARVARYAWEVQRSNRHGHLRPVANGDMRTKAQAKAMAVACARAFVDVERER